MSAADAVVFRGLMQTILITRGVPPKGGQFRQAGGGEVRGALAVHLAEDAAAVMELATFWVDSGGRPVSVMLQAELVAEVAAAVEAGRLWAFVFREPAYVSAADHQAAIKAAELAARAGPLAGSGPHRMLPPEMGLADRFAAVFRRAAPLVGPELRAQLVALVEDPASLAIAVGTMVILAQLHTVAAGEAIDAVVLSAIVACGVMRGVGLYQAISAALEAVVNIVAFVIATAAAKEEKDLDEAARSLAAGVSSIGVTALMLTLAWISGRFSDSLKKAGGKKGVGKVSKEEMAGKTSGAGQIGAAEEAASTSPVSRRPRPFQDEPKLPAKARETTSEFQAKRSGGVDMDNLSAADREIATKLRAAGYSADKVEEVLNSGRDFRLVDGRKGDQMYGFSSKYYAKGADSPYWVDEKTFSKLKDGYFDSKTGKWDSAGIKNELALPCYNRADAVYQGQLKSNQSMVASTINPATEAVVHVGKDGAELANFGRTMAGGGTQFTPAKGSVGNIGELGGQ